MAVRLLPGASIPSAATLDAAAAAFSALPETGRISCPLVFNLATGAVLEAWHDRAAPEDVPSGIRFRPPTGNVAQVPMERTRMAQRFTVPGDGSAPERVEEKLIALTTADRALTALGPAPEIDTAAILTASGHMLIRGERSAEERRAAAAALHGKEPSRPATSRLLYHFEEAGVGTGAAPGVAYGGQGAPYPYAAGDVNELFVKEWRTRAGERSSALWLRPHNS